MRRARPVLLFAWAAGCLAMPLASHAGPFIRFDRLQPEFRGAAVPGVSSVLQDKEGFLWFGTNIGLARYDGYKFDFFSPRAETETTSPPLVVYPVFEDGRGDLWIGTSGQGLFRFDRATETFRQFRIPSARPPESGGDIVLAIQEDANGDLWVGTRLDGLLRFDREKKTFGRIALDPEAGSVWDLLVDRHGSLWVGTQEGGLYRRDPATGTMARFRFSPDDPRSLGSDTVWTIFEDKEGTIWVGTRGGGLNRFVRESESFVRFTGDAAQPRDLVSPAITALAEDKAGRLWIGTAWDGVRIWDRTSGDYVVLKHDSQDPETLGDDNVTSILRDASGVVWVGTTRGGINKSPAGLEKFAHFKHDRLDPRSLSRNDVRSLGKGDAERLWVGFDEGLDEVEERSGLVRRFRHDPSDRAGLGPGAVLAVLDDGRGSVWVGLDGGGLDRLDRRSGRVVHYRNDPANPESLSNNTVTAIAADRADPGFLWVGTQQGLNKLETRTNLFTRFLSDPSNPASLSGNAVLSLLEGRSGFLWVGTRSGLNRLEKSAGKCERYVGEIQNPSGRGPNDNFINCLHEDSAGILWLGTNSGLNRFDPGRGEWRYYLTGDGLPGEVVAGILEDEAGNLWIGTNRGLARLDPRNGKFTPFGLHDGIQAEAFNGRAFCRDADGRMYFGGVNGYNVFRPAEIKADPFVPPLVWTAFSRNNRRIANGETLARQTTVELSALDRFVSFEFAALLYVHPPANAFAFKLEPRDKEWVNLGREHQVFFPGLPSGRHVLRVKGASPDGIWNENGLSLALTVVPPFWKTPWFLALAGLIIVTGVASVFLMWVKVRSAYRRAKPNVAEAVEKYQLTAREAEILGLILQGASNKDIAGKLFISASTVRNHIYNIYQKLGVKNRLGLVNLISREISPGH